MTEYSIVLLVCLAIIAALAILIYVSSRGKSLRQIARYHRISTATVRRVLASQPSEEQAA